MSSPRDTDCFGRHAVYRCYAADGTLLYVGCAHDVASRMYHHLATCNIGKQPNGALFFLMDTYTVEWFKSKLEARAGERKAILEEKPVLNRQHNPARFKKGPQGRSYVFVGEVHPISAWAFGEPALTPPAISALSRAKRDPLGSAHQVSRKAQAAA